MKEEREYIYYLPKEENNEVNVNEVSKNEKHITKTNSIIIIGANGSGKSRLGAWIAQQDVEGVHRICAQRSLVYNDDITYRPFLASESLLLSGNIFGEDEQMDKSAKYGNSINDKVTRESNDFDYVLATVISLYNQETSNFFENGTSESSDSVETEKRPESVIDKIKNIWRVIFTHRELKYNDGKFIVKYVDEEYSASQMSDGERAVLYLASQVLCIRNKNVKKIIIDEPEIHLHPSIMHNLWLELEKARKDLLFIYITHDINFITTHKSSDKIWVSKYYGDEKWSYEVLDKNDVLPEELLIEILGCRQNILFVESNRDHDYRLYTVLFPNMYVIPSGGCEQVIRWTKAVNQLNDNYKLYQYKAYGLIDRDYKSDEEIGKYEKSKVYCIKVAELENLFITESVLKSVAKKQGIITNWDSTFERIKDFVINANYKKNMDSQILDNIIYEINMKIGFNRKSVENVEQVESMIDNMIYTIKYEEIRDKIKKKYKNAINKGYHEILTIYNDKSVVASVGNYLNLDNSKYRDIVIDLLSADTDNELKDSFYKHMPKEIIEINKSAITHNI